MLCCLGCGWEYLSSLSNLVSVLCYAHSVHVYNMYLLHPSPGVNVKSRLGFTSLTERRTS